MRLVRQLAGAAFIVFALWAVRQEAILPYQLNILKREIADRTDEAFRSQTTARELAGQLARDNAAVLEPWGRRFPMDADLQVIRAANLRLVGRTAEAIHCYETAVHYQPTPEMYMSLGQTQLAAGIRAGDENLRRAAAFSPAIAEEVRRFYERTTSH